MSEKPITKWAYKYRPRCPTCGGPMAELALTDWFCPRLGCLDLLMEGAKQ